MESDAGKGVGAGEWTIGQGTAMATTHHYPYRHWSGMLH